VISTGQHRSSGTPSRRRASCWSLTQGPCTDAFWQRAPVPVRDVTREGGEEIAAVLVDASFRAALSVPVELAGGPTGTLDAYVRSERRWNESEVSALQACAGVVANLLGQAVAAWTQGRLARQLQIALEHRVVIEQAKGALMEREGVDASIAFERLRSVARSRHRTVVEVADDVLAGVPLPSDPAGRIHQTRELAVVAYLQAAGLHERIAALYEQLGHPDRARQERQRAAGARRGQSGKPSARPPTRVSDSVMGPSAQVAHAPSWG
jgi:hypothetical protein